MFFIYAGRSASTWCARIVGILVRQLRQFLDQFGIRKGNSSFVIYKYTSWLSIILVAYILFALPLYGMLNVGSVCNTWTCAFSLRECSLFPFSFWCLVYLIVEGKIIFTSISNYGDITYAPVLIFYQCLNFALDIHLFFWTYIVGQIAYSCTLSRMFSVPLHQGVKFLKDILILYLL